MIATFNLNKVLVMAKRGQLPSEFLNPQGAAYLDQWIKFSVELLKIRGNTPTRVGFSYIDRTGAVPSVVNTYIPEDQLIPTGKPATFDYLEVCLSRAKQLLDTNKHINVMWSGGLDSTIVLFSLLRTARNLDQLSVVCTFESILESGSMFDQHILPTGIRVKFDQTRQECTLPYSYDNEDTEQLYVNGQCGDHMFGITQGLRIPGVEPSDPWYSGYSKHFLDILEPSFKYSERPIETIRDLRWWLFFNHCWTTNVYDDCIERPAHLCHRIVPFYATPEFQRWTIHTPTFYEKMDQWRWPAKLALSKLIDYPYYVNNKQKCQSPTWIKSSNWIMLDKNFKNYYDNEKN